MAQLHESYGLDYSLVLSSNLATESLDLQLMVAEINMYEDMFGPFMRIEVVLNDALGLIDKFPVIGEEELLFTYSIVKKQVFRQAFKVYKVSNRTLTKAREHTVVLHGISLEGHENSLQSVYKPFIEQTPDQIVSDVFYNYIWSGIGKTLRIPKPCDKPYTKVASGQNPLQLINFLAAESKNSEAKDYKNPSNYVFFEASEDFYFAPIDYFFDTPVHREFFLSVPQDKDQFEKGKKTYPSKSIVSFKFVEQFDNLDSVHRGTYLNEVNIIDPILKRFKMHPITEKTKFQFKYNRDFDDLTHLPNSNKKYITADGDVGKGTKPYAAHRRMMITQYENEGEKYQNIGYLNGKLSAGDQLNAPRQRHKHLPESLHEMENLFNHMVEVTVPGDPELTIGQVIKIKVPQPTQFKDETQKFLFLYGQEATFVVTAIRHLYNANRDSYNMVLSCSAESFGKDVEGMRVI